jgi:hypothetical protein
MVRRGRTCLTFSFQIPAKCLRWKTLTISRPPRNLGPVEGEEDRRRARGSHQIRQSELPLPPASPFCPSSLYSSLYCLCGTSCSGPLVAIIYARQRTDLLSVRLLKTFPLAAIGEKNSRVSSRSACEIFASIHRVSSDWDPARTARRARLTQKGGKGGGGGTTRRREKELGRARARALFRTGVAGPPHPSPFWLPRFSREDEDAAGTRASRVDYTYTRVMYFCRCKETQGTRSDPSRVSRLDILNGTPASETRLASQT